LQDIWEIETLAILDPIFIKKSPLADRKRGGGEISDIPQPPVHRASIRFFPLLKEHAAQQMTEEYYRQDIKVISLNSSIIESEDTLN